tara:strand:+ start:270 stop:1100 length:831 start_codon:yes stop_codon:yes gene_type:complete
MVNKYFSVTVAPDVIMGDVSDVHDATDGIALAAGDLVADWHGVDVPKGVNMLHNISMIVNNVDAGTSRFANDLIILFAKSVNGVAPSSIKGNGFGTAPAFGGNIRDHIIGGMKLESTTDNTEYNIPIVDDFLGVSMYQYGHPAALSTKTTSPSLPMVLEMDPDSGTNVGYDKLYVALLNMSGTSTITGTNVLADGAVDASAAQSKTITVKTTDARALFNIGDQVYVMDLDTPIPGTLTKVERFVLTFSEANTTVDIADDDELLNANPIRLKLGFER